VLALAERVREDGVDAQLHQYGPGHRQRFDSLDGMSTELGAVHLSGFAPKPEENYANLCDFLTGRAGVVPAKLGPLKTRAREASSRSALGAQKRLANATACPSCQRIIFRERRI
jgi:hypothetical protein